MKRHIYDCSAGCPVESALQIISGKWKCVILFHLIKNKTCRFSELQKRIPGCSRRMLSLQLNEMIQDKIISKTIYPTIPPKTNYCLTEFGETLIPLVTEMELWGQMYNKMNKSDNQPNS